MAQTYETYEANGASRQFSFAFPYLHEDDVYVSVDDELVSFEYLSANIIQLPEPPEEGATVRIQRITPADRPSYDFQLGAPFLPRFIDTNFTQSIYAIQEALDAANLATDIVEELLKGNVGKLTINDQTGVDYTLKLEDTGNFIRMDNSAVNRVTVPLNESVEFALGSIVLVRQIGSGSTRIVGSTGVTLNAPSGMQDVTARNFGVALVKVAEDEWDIINSVGNASTLDLDALSMEIDLRLDEIYAEMLSNDPTFVVNFDSLIRKVEAARYQNEDLEGQILGAVASALETIRQRVSSLENTAILHGSRLDDLELNTETPPGIMDTDGMQRLPGGLVLQWATIPFGSLSTSDVTIERNFPEPFPNACLQVILSDTAFKQTKNARTWLGAYVDSFTKARVTIKQYGDKDPDSGDWRIFAIGH